MNHSMKNDHQIICIFADEELNGRLVLDFFNEDRSNEFWIWGINQQLSFQGNFNKLFPHVSYKN